jgi:capsule biosynthesis phosphatase
MKLVIDLDGTICPIRQSHESYADLPVLPGAAEKIRELRQNGHYVIIQTARNMGTQQSNLGKVMKNIGKITLEWLEKNGIEYDEIYFGKPNGDVYIDDRAFRFQNWNDISEDSLSKIAKEK